jgi:predicted nucleotidyltransferase
VTADNDPNKAHATTQATPDWLPRAIERIVSRFSPAQIILFGSRARGEGRPDSDLDLLVVLPAAADRRAAAVAVMRELRDLPVGKDIVITTPEHLAERGQVNGLIYKTAVEEGQVVYERG